MFPEAKDNTNRISLWQIAKSRECDQQSKYFNEQIATLKLFYSMISNGKVSVDKSINGLAIPDVTLWHLDPGKSTMQYKNLRSLQQHKKLHISEIIREE